MYNDFLSGASVVEHLAAFTFAATIIFTGISIRSRAGICLAASCCCIL